MTQEEKAKAYDEALKRAKEMYDAYRLSVDRSNFNPTDFEYIFPALCGSEDEKIRKWLYDYISNCPNNNFAFYGGVGKDAVLNYLEKQKETNKAMEAVDRIDKYIDEHVANAHDMKDSNPDKKYYSGWDDALGKMAGILQDVYSDEKQKEHQNNSDAPNESSWSGMISSSDKDKNLDDIAQEYVDGVRQYNPEPTWDLMQTAVCYGYHLAEQKEQKPVKLDDDTEVGLDRALQIVKDAKGNLCGYQSDDGIYECDHAIQTLERILKNGIEQKPENGTVLKGFVAVDYSDVKTTWNPTGRRVSFFTKKPVRDLLTEIHYWASTGPYYERIKFDYKCFPELKWEDEPVEVELVIYETEQKPVESITQDEIERAMKTLTDFKVFAAEEAKQYNISHRRDIDWHNFCASLLTYLEVNKPVEWSEEDEHRITDAIYFLESAKIHYADTSEIDKTIAWFKSLRASCNCLMIQWTGKNLKEVIDFTGKSPKFNEWFKSWDEFESYVHSHGDIIKLFGEDGSYYEVPVGAWIIKTPDGYNIPSRFKFVQNPVWSDGEMKVLDSIIDDYEKAAKSFCGYDGKIGFLKAIRNGEYNLPNPTGMNNATINGEPISTENQTVKVGDDETEVQKAYREGKNAGRKEVFDHPEYYGLQPRRMYDYETGKRNLEFDELQADFRNINEAFEIGKKEVVDNPEKYGLYRPAEWNEEDEVMLKEIISFFKDGSVKLQHDLDLYAGFLEKRLKSLCQSWNPIEAPTKEELYILKWLAINVLGDDVAGRAAAKRLLSLHDKIKNI